MYVGGKEGGRVVRDRRKITKVKIRANCVTYRLMNHSKNLYYQPRKILVWPPLPFLPPIFLLHSLTPLSYSPLPLSIPVSHHFCDSLIIIVNATVIIYHAIIIVC
jgi:hypothetical protein